MAEQGEEVAGGQAAPPTGDERIALSQNMRMLAREFGANVIGLADLYADHLEKCGLSERDARAITHNILMKLSAYSAVKVARVYDGREPDPNLWRQFSDLHFQWAVEVTARKNGDNSQGEGNARR